MIVMVPTHSIDQDALLNQSLPFTHTVTGVTDLEPYMLRVTTSAEADPSDRVVCLIQIDGRTAATAEATGPGATATCLAYRLPGDYGDYGG